MVEMPQDNSKLTDEEARVLLTALRRKEGNWVSWAEACQNLQKSGWNPQKIFEETGFEPIQQNQIIGAAQVYASMLTVGISEPVKLHFSHRASDVLYQFRVLTPQERSAAAAFAFERNMDMEDAKELAKAMKDFSRLAPPPPDFSAHPGDVMAYYAWQAAKQKPDLQSRSMFIAKGLKFAQTGTARQQIEQLLTDFTVTPTKRVPRLPVYRLDSEEELPRVLPMVGQMPLSKTDLQAVPLILPQEPFGMVRSAGESAWVPVPGWHVIRTAEDPVALIMQSQDLPTALDGEASIVLVILDRAKRVWDEDSYFMIADANDNLVVKCFDQAPESGLLGKVILIMRPRKILDESYTQELYQWDE